MTLCAVDIEGPTGDIVAAHLGVDILELSPGLQISPREIAESASVKFEDYEVSITIPFSKYFINLSERLKGFLHGYSIMIRAIALV